MTKKTEIILRALLMFLAKRMGEASTWAAIASMLVGAHIMINPGVWQHIVDAGVAVSGLLGFVLTEGEDDEEDQK